MKNVTSIIYISCILLSLCNIHILYAQKITPPDSTTIQQKVTKYGKVKLRTSIMQVSLDAVKANLICGKDTLKEDYKVQFFSFGIKFPSVSHEPSCGPTDSSQIPIHFMYTRDKLHKKTFI